MVLALFYIVLALLSLLIFTKSAITKKVHASKEALRNDSVSNTDISEDIVAYHETGANKTIEGAKQVRVRPFK